MTDVLWPSMKHDGYVVLPGRVHRDRLDPALRLLGLALREHGVTAEQVADWQSTTWFPHLRDDPAILGLLPVDLRAALARPAGVWCEPQIMVRLPDRPQEWPLTPHVDTEPPWADGRRYRWIVGVSLTECGIYDGALAVWPGSHDGRRRDAPVRLPMHPGDVVVMDPRLDHAGTLNLGWRTRVAVYFRLLAATGER